MYFVVLVIAVILSILLVYSNSDIGFKAKYENPVYRFINNELDFHHLQVNEKLTEVLSEHEMAIVMFITPWNEKCRKIKNYLEKTNLYIIIVDDKHPDSSFTDSFPSVYMYNGKTLKKKDLYYFSKCNEEN